MKNLLDRKKLFVIAAGGVLLSAAAAPMGVGAQVTVDVEVDAVSRYVWRGEVLADAFALQPGITFGVGDSGVSLNIWGSGALRKRDAFEASDELDFTLGYGRSVADGLGLEAGIVLYTFPSGDEGNRTSPEIYASLGLESLLAPSLTAAYDFRLVDGLYLEAAVGPEFPVSTTATLGLGASASASNVYGRDFGFHAFHLSAGLGFDLGQLTLGPFLGFSYADDDIHPGNSEFWTGVSLGFSR